MCGILAVVYPRNNSESAQKLIDELIGPLSRRGHDHLVQSHFSLRTAVDGSSVVWKIGVVGCVLHMRGPLTAQPVLSENGDWLLWNGEVYDSSMFKVGESDNDAVLVLKSLQRNSVQQVLSSIHGPWSTVYFEAKAQCLWFGRDVLGRRSLCWHLPKDNSDLFAISSVACLTPGSFPEGYWEEVPSLGIFQLALDKELINEPGSINCYQWLYKDSGIPHTPCTDILSSLITIHKESYITTPFQMLNKSITSTEKDHSLYLESCQRLLELLQEAVLKRVATWKGSENIGILFSGGVDSVVIAALADRCLDFEKEIDLINVAFDQSSDQGEIADFSVPDRASAIQAIQELNPSRKWNLILVNVSKQELLKWRTEHIYKLIHPLNTVMDDSIGCALWFAARGKGVQHENGKPYESQCKVLLVGMGADEQFAGYARHRTSYQRAGWEGVVHEVSKDLNRISSRNLGRDDRCISDHNREARYPYLDEKVVDFVNSLPIWIKTDYSHPRGIGEKCLLRRVAKELGCQKAAELPKRAIQFGSRIAKISGTSGNRLSGNDIITYD